jgi:dihydrofolate reductase
MTSLAVMVAVAANGVIGNDQGLPWHLPEDLRYFKRVTLGKPIVMGRRTFESIGRALPGRTNIVISRNPELPAEGVSLVASLDEALERAGEIARREAVDEFVVIGGAQIYGLAIPKADRLYVTEVHARVSGDTALPDIAWERWRETAREPHPATTPDQYGYSFVVYERRIG